MLVEPASCVLRGLERGRPQPGETVGVIGIGTLGSLAITLARLHAPGALVAAVFQANGLEPPKPLVKTIAIQLTVSLIASGEFVGILPRSVAALNAPQAALRKYSRPRISAEIVFLENRTLSPAVNASLRCARPGDRQFRLVPYANIAMGACCRTIEFRHPILTHGDWKDSNNYDNN